MIEMGGRFGMVAASGIICAAIGWFLHDLVGSVGESSGASERGRPVVTALTVTNGVFRPVQTFIGRIEPCQEVDVLPQVDGYITSVCFQEGANVRQGDVLFEIDVERYEVTSRLRKAELEKAKGEVLVAEAEVDRCKRYLSRLQRSDMRGVARNEIDDAETGLAVAQAALESARAGVRHAMASVELSEVDLKHTRVYAPFSGRVGKALRHVGDYVSASKGALARVVQFDPIRVSFHVPDREYLTWQESFAEKGIDFRATRRFRLQMANDTVYDAEGIWEFEDNEMNAGTATMRLRLSVPNPLGRLVPNSFVRVLCDERSPAQVIAVPETAVEILSSGLSVWVVGDDDTVRRRSIAAAYSAEGMVVVADGLQPGERIVWGGLHKVSEGQLVTLSEVSE